ncbi:MAG: RluA family pseudouridine synthase [Clostridiales Family XIII bacterium]|jgi:23S rRNA pseudouridine1911/1915/1917 synthase|nr:RluA family pseudouridine synthase [Clostridiales Family XIII bacterium]
MDGELFLETDEYDLLIAEFDEAYEGMRLDAALAAYTEQVSRNRAQALIEAGDVTVNGEPQTKKKYRVRAGDRAEIKLYLSVPVDILPEKIALDIVYEDDDVLVVNKPKGMVVHPAPGSETGTLVNALLFHLAGDDSLSGVGGKLRPGIVHRIDKNTSGLIIIAKNDAAHAALSGQLAAHSVTRVYEAIVAGGFKDDEGTIDAPLARDPKNRKRQRVSRDGSGKRAVTHYRVLERYAKYTLLELRLETGRTHQIRVHLASIGHPVLGDDLYGPADGDGQYLHAKTLGFAHPASGEYIEFSVEPPEDFRAMREKLRLTAAPG